MTGFDLTMNYYNDFGYQDYLFIGQVSDSAVALLSYDAGRLRLTTQSVTRTSYPAPLSWDMPEEVVQQLAVQPFVRAGSDLLLTLCNGDGTCTPLSLSVSGGSGLGKTVGADAMVPFWTVAASDEPDKFYQVGGYAVSKDGVTQLRLFNASGDGHLRGDAGRGSGHGAVAYGICPRQLHAGDLPAVRGGWRAPHPYLRCAEKDATDASGGIRLFADRGGKITAFSRSRFVFVRILRIFTG